MFFNRKQLKLFKGVRERVWYQQERLRTPYRRQYYKVLNIYFKEFANKIEIAYQTRSQIMLDMELRKQADKLKLILTTLYRSVAYAFKDYALGRFFSKDFDDDFENQLAEFIALNTGIWVADIDETTRKRLAKVIDNSYNDGLSVEATGVALRNTVIGMGVYRANLISRTEVHRVAGFANETVAENMKIDNTVKEWVAIQDARTRLSHSIASGQRVPLEANFVVGGERLKYPGDPRGSPGETINCRCAAIYITPDFL
jgi:hypothetical protein